MLALLSGGSVGEAAKMRVSYHLLTREATLRFDACRSSLTSQRRCSSRRFPRSHARSTAPDRAGTAQRARRGTGIRVASGRLVSPPSACRPLHPVVAVSDPVDVSAVLRRFNDRLSEQGLKSTRQRDAIVETFFRLDAHISVEELLEAVRIEFPRIGFATVYRTMKLLVEQGFADARRFGDGQTRFDPRQRPDDQHDHLICVDCRRVIEFSDDAIERRIHEVAAERGQFVLKRRTIELYVRCTAPSCEHRQHPEDA